jgi:putative phosphoesterase
MLVAVIADTHLPRGRRALSARCVELIETADAVIHAGDFVTVSVLRELEAIGPPVHGVHGNVDEPELRRLLPAELTLELSGKTIAVLHDAGPARGRLDRLRRRFPHADAVIFGHSHMPAHETSGDFQTFNPGSPTERRRAERRSMGLMRVTRRRIEFEQVGLP